MTETTETTVDLITAEMARQLSNQNTKDATTIEPLIRKINRAIVESAQRGHTKLCPNLVLQMKSPTEFQWTALRDYYMGQGFKWDLLYTNERQEPVIELSW